MSKTTYRGHTITETEEMGWSDFQQRMVHNGWRIRVEGPHYSTSFQDYSGLGAYIYRAIDNAIAKAEAKGEVASFDGGPGNE